MISKASHPQRLPRVPQGILSPPCPGDWMEQARLCQKLTVQPGCRSKRKAARSPSSPPRKQKSRSPLPKSPPSSNFQGTIQAPGSRVGSMRQERVQRPRPPVWVPTSYLPGRASLPEIPTMSPAAAGAAPGRTQLRSPAHPTGPARPGPVDLGAALDAGSGPRAMPSSGQLRGGACAAGCSAVRLGKGGLGQRTRGICGSARPFPQPRALPDRLRTSAEFAKSVPRGPAQPPHFPESAGGGRLHKIKALPGARAAAAAAWSRSPGARRTGPRPAAGDGRGARDPAPGPGHRLDLASKGVRCPVSPRQPGGFLRRVAPTIAPAKPQKDNFNWHLLALFGPGPHG